MCPPPFSLPRPWPDPLGDILQQDSFHTIEELSSTCKSLGRSANMTAEMLTRHVLQEMRCSDSDSATTKDTFQPIKYVTKGPTSVRQSFRKRLQ